MVIKLIQQVKIVLFPVSNCFGNNPKHSMLGLPDTGATGIFMKRHALNDIEHQAEHVILRVKGCYAHSHFEEVTIFGISYQIFVAAVASQSAPM
jgi:hypothetical protein